MSGLAEIAIIQEAMTVEGTTPKVAMAAKGVAPEVVSVEVLAEVHKSLRLAKMRPTSTKEGPKTKRDKKKAPQPVHALAMKHRRRKSLLSRRRES